LKNKLISGKSWKISDEYEGFGFWRALFCPVYADIALMATIE